MLALYRIPLKEPLVHDAPDQADGPVMGVDIHLIQPPGPVPPVPIPHPFIAMVLDVAEFFPVIGATVIAPGMPAAIAGVESKAIPPHVPMGAWGCRPLRATQGGCSWGAPRCVVRRRCGEPHAAPFTDYLGNQKHLYYNVANLHLRTRDAIGDVAKMVQSIDPKFHVEAFLYDPAGDLLQSDHRYAPGTDL